jgi:hypothetical protein
VTKFEKHSDNPKKIDKKIFNWAMLKLPRLESTLLPSVCCTRTHDVFHVQHLHEIGNELRMTG